MIASEEHQKGVTWLAMQKKNENYHITKFPVEKYEVIVKRQADIMTDDEKKNITKITHLLKHNNNKKLNNSMSRLKTFKKVYFVYIIFFL